jgi:uncharacterized protein YoxC
MARPLRAMQADVARATAHADALITEVRQAVAVLTVLAAKLDRIFDRVDDLAKSVREEGLSVRTAIAGHKIPAEIVIQTGGDDVSS